MAELVRYVNTASTPGTQDGTTTTSGSSGTAAYASLSDALVAEATNLVSAGDNLVIYCLGAEDSDRIEPADWSGFTTGASNDIKILPYTGNEAGTEWDTGKYHLYPSVGFVAQIQCGSDQYVTFENIQIGCGSGSGFTGIFTWTAATDGTSSARFHLLRCHLRFRAGSASSHFLHMNWSMRSADVVVANNIFDRTGATAATEAACVAVGGEVYNNTMYGPLGTGGIWYRTEASGIIITANVKNNLIEDTDGSGDCFRTADVLTSSATNVSSDATSPQTGLRNLTATFTSSTDFSLQSGDTAAKDAGTDLSADANYAFSIDILGVTRSGTWDIGAYEFPGAGGVVIPRQSLDGMATPPGGGVRGGLV